MPIKQIQIDVNELTIGMFVSALDCAWSQTPFPLQGFYIRDVNEIKDLKTHCRYVFIDVRKGASPLEQKASRTLHKKVPSNSRNSSARMPSGTVAVPVSTIRIDRTVYNRTTPLKSELKQAKAFYSDIAQSLDAVSDQLSRHQSISALELKMAVGNMVGSVLRSPDAFTWLSQVNSKDTYTYNHALRCAVWSVIFGRHMGLAKGDLDILAAGVILKDIGKIKLTTELLEKHTRTAGEQQEYERFVEHGITMLRDSQGIHPKIISVVKTHCERVNGSGFPQFLRGDKIPLLGKMAGLVTFYDETVNSRGASQPLSPSNAVSVLYKTRNQDFQEQLVVEFIRAIGLYPTGTTVILSTGEVGVVVEQNFEQRLRPKILVLTNPQKERLDKAILIDLAEEYARSKKNKQPKVEIKKDIEPGAYGIDAQEARDIYFELNSPKGFLAKLFKA